jgi:hypothetical protein
LGEGRGGLARGPYPAGGGHDLALYLAVRVGGLDFHGWKQAIRDDPRLIALALTYLPEE